MPPPALHVVAGRLVRYVAARDRILEVLVLLFDDLVGSDAGEREVAGAAQLSAGHGLHRSALASRRLVRIRAVAGS